LDERSTTFSSVPEGMHPPLTAKDPNVARSERLQVLVLVTFRIHLLRDARVRLPRLTENNRSSTCPRHASPLIVRAPHALGASYSLDEPQDLNPHNLMVLQNHQQLARAADTGCLRVEFDPKVVCCWWVGGGK
jgi:hypothetical protein